MRAPMSAMHHLSSHYQVTNTSIINSIIDKRNLYKNHSLVFVCGRAIVIIGVCLVSALRGALFSMLVRHTTADGKRKQVLWQYWLIQQFSNSRHSGWVGGDAGLGNAGVATGPGLLQEAKRACRWISQFSRATLDGRRPDLQCDCMT